MKEVDKLESFNVFIDTQYFVKTGLNFNTPTLVRFVDLCREFHIHHYSTDVVSKEVKAKIHDSVGDAFNALNKFRRKIKILEQTKKKEINKFFSDLNQDTTTEEAISVFENFLGRTNTRNISVSSVNPDKVFQLYFEEKKPFGKANKKSEFPDAFSLLALENKARDIDEKIYVISEDNDVVGFCENHDFLICLPSLEKFIDAYNQHEEALSEQLYSILESEYEHLKEKVQDCFKDMEFYNESVWEDSEIIASSISKIEIDDVSLIYVGQEEAQANFTVKIEYEITASGPDYHTGTYDKEDGILYCFQDETKTEFFSETISVDMWLGYEVTGGKIEDAEVNEIEWLDYNSISSVCIEL